MINLNVSDQHVRIIGVTRALDGIRQKTEVRGSDDTVSLPRPFGQDKPLRALFPNDGAEKPEHHDR